MELQQLKYFKAVAEAGKISDAAKALFISSPALSTSISRLEADIGYRLFDRTNNSVSLNRQGQIFLKHVNDIFRSIDRAQDEMQASTLEDPNHIGVACISTTGLVDLIAAFSKTHPHLFLSCSEFKPDELASGELADCHDFLIGAESDIPDRLSDTLESIPLFEDDIMIAVSPDHALASRTQISVRELADEKLLFPMPSYPLFRNLNRLFAAYDMTIPMNNAYSYLMSTRLAAHGVGIAFSSSHMKDLVGLPLVYIPVSDPHSSWTCRLYWQRGKIFTSQQTVFKQFTQNFYQNASD